MNRGPRSSLVLSNAALVDNCMPQSLKQKLYIGRTDFQLKAVNLGGHSPYLQLTKIVLLSNKYGDSLKATRAAKFSSILFQFVMML